MTKIIEILRAAITIIGIGLFGVGAFFISYLIYPFIRLFYKEEKKRLELYSNVIHYSWRLFCNFMRYTGAASVKKEDFEKLKNIKNSIIVSTHTSYIDVVIMLAAIPKTTCFVAKRITQNFVMGSIVKSMFITPDDNVEDIVKNSKKMLDYGFNILIFPSGKRHELNAKPHLKKGAALIAASLKKDILPIKLQPDFEFLKRNEPVYKAGKKTPLYQITVLEPIKIQEFLDKYDDVVELKKQLTAKIFEVLFN